ncbi:MAG: transposase [Bacteroidetes bacterium]|nr:transposase [Bacteroidota bacterium]
MDCQFPQRKHIRLKGFNYHSDGAYYITICTHERQCLFGSVIGGKILLNPLGIITQEEWRNTLKCRTVLCPDGFIVMPNHVHLIVFLQQMSISTTHGQNESQKLVSLGSIIGQFKRQVSFRVRHYLEKSDFLVWQRGYYEHIIRSDRELTRIRRYMQENPLRWEIKQRAR